MDYNMLFSPLLKYHEFEDILFHHGLIEDPEETETESEGMGCPDGGWISDGDSTSISSYRPEDDASEAESELEEGEIRLRVPLSEINQNNRYISMEQTLTPRNLWRTHMKEQIKKKPKWTVYIDTIQ
jgi:hypothetical protein